MKQGLSELVFILDKSGSMSGMEKDTIDGYNATLDTNKEADGECKVTTVLFDDNYTLLHDRVDIKEIKHITKKEYVVGGNTALLDALGRTINSIGCALHETPEDERPEKVLFVIITDGEENHSVEFTADQIRGMVDHQRDVYKWEFLFLGANIDAVRTASQYGIPADRAQDYLADHEGSKAVYMSVASASLSFRKSGVLDGWNTDVRKDFEVRSGRSNRS